MDTSRIPPIDLNIIKIMELEKIIAELMAANRFLQQCWGDSIERDLRAHQFQRTPERSMQGVSTPTTPLDPTMWIDIPGVLRIYVQERFASMIQL